MALDTYANLQASIAAWMDRTDLTAVIPDFISLFEADANAELPLRTRFNLVKTTITTVVNTQTISVPADYLEAAALVNTSQSFPGPLSPYTATALYTQFPNATNVADAPKGFTPTSSGLDLGPMPDSAYPLLLYYYQKVTPLSVSNTTNWLLQNFPNLYLFGSLVSAEAYLGDDPRIETWGNLYDDMIQKLAGSTARGLYGAAPLSVKSDAYA